MQDRKRVYSMDVPNSARIALVIALLGSLQSRCNAAEESAPSSALIQTAWAGILAAFQRGGPTMWVLAALALAGTIFGIAVIARLSRRRHVPREFEKDVVHMADTKGIDAAISLCKQKPSSLSRVLHAPLLRHGGPLSQLEAAVRHESALAQYALLRPVRALGWLAAFSPLLGLIGLALNLAKNVSFSEALSSEAVESFLVLGLADGLLCLVFGLITALVLLALYVLARCRARDIAHDIEVKSIDAVVTLDRKARQSIRLIEDIEDKIKTESMIKVPDLSAEFDEHPHAQESAIKTAVTTHSGQPVKEQKEDA